MGKPIKISKRVQQFLDNEPLYAETLGYNTLTFSQAVSNELFVRDPLPDELEEFISSFSPDEMALADSLLTSACGWTAESIIEMSRESHDDNIVEFLQQEIDSDDSCPFEQTVEALNAFNDNCPGIERQRVVANEVFEFLFDTTAEEMLNSVKSSITSAYNRTQVPSPSP